MKYSEMTISEIADVINNDWKNSHISARPYLEAMYHLKSVKDNFYQDSGKSIVIYFLSNANQWKGVVAREVKKELNKRIK